MNNTAPIPCGHRGPHMTRLGFVHCTLCRADQPLWRMWCEPGTSEPKFGYGCRMCNPTGRRVTPERRARLRGTRVLEGSVAS